MKEFLFIYYAFVIFLFGIVIGSFLNVCIYRIPIKQTIVTIPSHCIHCSHKLLWYDLVPFFSYLFLKGKCRYCNKKISIRYPFVEILNALLYLALYIKFDISVDLIVYCSFFSSLIVLSFIDIKYQIVPDCINVFILIITIPILILDRVNWLSHLIGFFSVSVPLLIVAIISNGMGGGDIKLYAVIGLLVGWVQALLSIFFTSIIAAVFGIAIVIKNKDKNMKAAIPLVPFISVSILITTFWTDEIINWYISSFF